MDSLDSAFFAAFAGAILAPVLGWLVARRFPPRNPMEPPDIGKQSDSKYRVVEWAGVVFFMFGMVLPFWLHGTSELEPTFRNIALMLSFAFLFMVTGIFMLSTLMGDPWAQGFCRYFERVRGINRHLARSIGKVMATVSGLILLGFTVERVIR